MKIISFKHIVELNISPLQCFKWVVEALEQKSEALLPPKVSLKPSGKGIFYNTMSVILPGEMWGGAKLVTRYPERKPCLDSEILLYNVETGENVALMDGNWITAMRTGAVAAHSVSLFAKDNFKTIGFIGLGNTSRATLKVLLAVYPKKQFVIKLKKYKNHHELFMDEFKQFSNIKFEVYDAFEELIAESDVVISAATVFERDICPDEYFKEGILVVPIHTRGFANCDLFFDKVFADDTNHVRGFKYFEQFRAFSEVSDVVMQKKLGRENDQERIIVYNIGIALHDIYFAGKIYEMIDGIGTEISLDAPKDKFWV